MGALSEGSTGGAVKKLQTNLNTVLKAGPKLKANGKFDGRTKEAVVKFQKQAGLSASGVADAGTMKSLKAHIDGLEWTLSDPARDRDSVADASKDMKEGVIRADKKFTQAELDLRRAADLIKKNLRPAVSKYDECTSKWDEWAKLLGDIVKKKQEFEAAKKVYDLPKQKAILAAAKDLEKKGNDLNIKAHASRAEAEKLAGAFIDAVEQLAKVYEKKEMKFEIRKVEKKAA